MNTNMNVQTNATASQAAPTRTGSWVATLLVGSAVAVGLGVYGSLHPPGSGALYTLGFSSMMPMKAWLATVVLTFAILQIVTALWMFSRLPRVGSAPAWVSQVHRWSGTAAFIFSLPVGFACLWKLGFSASDGRTMVHSIAGCLFYGTYAAKMIGLRLRAAPKWAVPVLGGIAFTLIVVLWLTSALWFFSTPGLAKI